MVEDFYTADELSYEDDDLLLVTRDVEEQIQQLEITLRIANEPGWTPEEGSWLAGQPRAEVEENLADTRALRQYLEQFANASASLPYNVRKLAFRLRWRNECIRVWMSGEYRSKMEYGYSFFVHFDGLQNAFAGDFGTGIDWQWTLRQPWCTEEDLPIRLPGIILRSDNVTISASPHPKKYETLFKEYDLETYFRLRSEIAESRLCQHCLARLPSDAATAKRYCNDDCRNAAKQSRYRERHPGKVKESQTNYWRSVIELQNKNNRSGHVPRDR